MLTKKKIYYNGMLFCFNIEMFLGIIADAYYIIAEKELFVGKLSSLIILTSVLFSIFLIFYGEDGLVLSKGVVFSSVILVLSIVSYFIVPSIELIFLKAFYYTIRQVIVPVIMISKINDPEYLEKVSLPYIGCSAIYAIVQMIYFSKTNIYSMSFSYTIIPYIILALSIGVNKSKRYLVSFCFLFICNLVCGSRGSILCCIIGAFMLLIIDNSLEKLLKKALAILGMFGIGVLFFDFFINILLKIFPSARSIRLLASGDFMYLSGRGEYYREVINELIQEPFIIRGLYSDRIYLAECFDRITAKEVFGSYAHNFILEMLFQFGCIIGGILLIFFILISLYAYNIIKKRNNSNALKNMYIIYTSYCVGKLLISGSYLTEFSFGAYVGILLLVIKLDKNNAFR